MGARLRGPPMASPEQRKLLQACALAAFAVVAAGDALAPDAPVQLACSPAADAPRPAPGTASAPPEPGQEALVAYLARRFMVAAEATELMVETAYHAATEVGLDPLLVLDVIAIESRFNPIAESGMGAKGLMQIIPRYHRDKLQRHGGEDAVLDPRSNIQVGARILQEYVYRTGTLEAGLQFYNGALRDGSAQYANKVMGERSRLEQVLRGG